jgi:hypothetical protein
VWDGRRFVVAGPDGAVELHDLTDRQSAEPRPTALLVIHTWSPELPAELLGAALEPDTDCPYMPAEAAGCRRNVQPIADSAIGASALEMSTATARGPMWLLMATVYGVTFADPKAVPAVLREAAT